MAFPIPLEFPEGPLFKGEKISIVLHGGLTTFVGPNGSGKTQVLRAMMGVLLKHHTGNREPRFLSGGRLCVLEPWRRNVHGTIRRVELAEGNREENEDRDRLTSETAYRDFYTLTKRPDVLIKVQERLKALFNRELIFKWDKGGDLTVRFRKTDDIRTAYPCGIEASGLLDIVVLLTALFDDQVGALLIDEPESSLHPQFQRFMLREIEKIADDPQDPRKKIVVIATHSPEFLDVSTPKDLTRIVFFQDAFTPPLQLKPEDEPLNDEKLKKHLAKPHEPNTQAFFARRTLLVEGPSDKIICSALDRRFQLHLDVGGTQIVESGGKGTMPVIAQVMKLIDKDVVLMADLDMVADMAASHDPRAKIQSLRQFLDNRRERNCGQERGHDNLEKFALEVLTDFSNAVHSNWQDIADRAKNHHYWKREDHERERHRRNTRSAMAVLLASAESDIQSWSNSSLWQPLKNDLTCLFESLEKAGCYVLRKGTIEDYYNRNTCTNGEKRDRAIEEAEHIADPNESACDLERRYADVLRALRHESETARIDESSAVAKLLVPTVPSKFFFLHSASDGGINGQSGVRGGILIGEEGQMVTLWHGGEF